MPRIIKSSKLGDAAILKEIINIFKKNVLRLSVHYILILN